MDEYVRRSYKFAHAETLEVGPIACLPEAPEPRDPSIQKKRRYVSLNVSGLISRDPYRRPVESWLSHGMVLLVILSVSSP